jgi:carboxypeptidase family protein
MMRVLILITMTFALLLVSGSAARAQQQDGRSPNDPSLWIEVRDENGAPLKNACITVVPKEGEILFRKADGRGRVRVRHLPRGRYRVTAKVDGYAAQKKEVEVSAAGEAEPVSVSLQPRN